MGLREREPKTYANIISDGTIRVKTSESDLKAVRRDYELKDGTKGTKFERVYHELSGIIEAIQFYEGDYGKTIHLVVKDGEEKIILSVGMQTNYADDLMKKLPSLDLTKEVTLKPYSFTDKEKKLRKGISINQGGNKIKSFFHDAENKPLHGFPVPDKKYTEMDSDDWKMYFIQTKKFLQKFIEDNLLLTFNDISKGLDIKEEIKTDEDEIKIDGIQF
jgi:hypothetical protein